MPVSLAQSLSDLRGILHEPRAVRWLDTDLEALLSLGQRHVAALTLSYQRQATFVDEDTPDALIAGLRDYTLNGDVGAGGLGLTDVLSVEQVYLNDTELTEILPKAVPTWNEATRTHGSPAAWYEFAGVLTLIPYPTTAFLVNYELTVVYAAQPVVWESGNSVLPEGMSDLVVWFAAALALFRAQKYADALAAYTNYIRIADAYMPVAVTTPETSRAALVLPPRAGRAQFQRGSTRASV